VVAGSNVAIKGFDGTTTVIAEPANDESFFDDLTADRHGRLIVGSVGIGPSPREGVRGGRCRPGRLYRLDTDGTRTVLAEDVLASNELGTSPDGDVLYHVDSYRQTIWAFDDADNRRKFADTSDYGGVPDGIAVAADGIVYVPMAGSGVVLGWDADGKIVAELPVPQPLVTSICFGAGDLRSLFVLTGVNDEHEDERGGAVYVTTAPSVGQASPVCAVVLRGDLRR
jgi:sugar lactone lactonase YvrE